MSEPREVCMRRPDLCGEPLWREAPGTGTVDMAELLLKMAGGALAASRARAYRRAT